MIMRIAPNGWRRTGLGMIGLVILVGSVRTWTVPASPDLQGTAVESLHPAVNVEGKNHRHEARRGAPIDDAVGRVAYEPAQDGPRSPGLPKRDGAPVRLPRSISTEIDLEDVELSELMARA